MSSPCVAAPRRQAPPAARMRGRQPGENPERTSQRHADARPKSGRRRASVLPLRSMAGYRSRATHPSPRRDGDVVMMKVRPGMMLRSQ